MGKKKIKIVVTGGGTGGHIMPLISIVEELRKENATILYIGSGNELERELAKKHRIKYRSILSGKMRRYFSLWNIVDAFKFLIGIIQSFFILMFYRPDVIFSKGGYVGLPVIYAGVMYGIPMAVHETDSVMGLANKLAAKKVEKIFTGFPIKFYKDVPNEKMFYTGNPIREELKNIKIKKLFDNERKTILITGGSQGARFINQTIAAIIPELTKKYNVIHIAGKNDYEWLKKNHWQNYKLFDFTNDLPNLMAQSDLIITRAGGTLAEIAYLHKPSIIIPLSTAANDHQMENAKIYNQTNAALMVSEKNLTPEDLLELIEQLMGNSDLRKLMSLATRNLSNPQAANIISRETISLVK